MYNNVYIDRYQLDEKNSSRARRATLTDPGEPASMAIHFSRIQIEAKMSELKKLKVGQTIQFKIDQTFDFDDFRRGETFSVYLCGVGEGEIERIEDIGNISNYEDDEVEELCVFIRDGYAEDL